MLRAFLVPLAFVLWALPSRAATVDGSVRYQGPVPAAKSFSVDRDPVCSKAYPGGVATDAPVVVDGDGGLANVFVVFVGGVDAAKVAPPPKTALVLDQKGCRFLPRVVGVRAGQPVKVGNDDATLHNVRAEAKHNPEFNVGLAPGKTVERVFSAAERMVRLHCHVHHWMTAWVGVVDHPFFAVSDARGRFRIADVPPGRYRVEAWHETLGTREATVVVDRKGTMEPLRFEYGSAVGRSAR